MKKLNPKKMKEKVNKTHRKKKRITHTRSSETEVSQLEPAKKGYER